MTENSDFDRSARRPDEPPPGPSFDPYAATPPSSSQGPSQASSPGPSGGAEPPPYSSSSPPSYSSPPPADPSSAPPGPSSGSPYGTPPGGYQPTGGVPYPPPPGGAYPAQGGYAAGYPAQPYSGAQSSDEKTWNLVSHFGGAGAVFLSSGALGWVPPLVSMLAKGKENPTVRMHAVEALNFQLTWAIVWFAGLVLGTCGLIIVVGAVLYLACLVAYVVAIVFGIIAGVKANNGEFYRYPMTIRMVK